MADPKQRHPLQRILDAIWNAGHTPRLLVDPTENGVRVPEGVRKKWGKLLPLDLDAKYPLDIHFSEEGISADLSFPGEGVSRCDFPWRSIRTVVDRETGAGIVFTTDGPELESPSSAAAAADTLKEAPRPKWVPRVIKGGKA